MHARRFEDDDGEVWNAWEVQPAAAERRSAADRRHAQRDDVWFERRGIADRRVRDMPRPLVSPELADGALAFESERRGERRRIVPAPSNWRIGDEGRLRDLLHGAAAVPRVVIPARRVHDERSP